MSEAPPAGRSLRGKVVLVSGGASGIGRAMTARFVADGARVAVADRDIEAAQAAAAPFGADAIPIGCDVCDEAAAGSAVEAVLGAFGRLDGFVHNAAAASLDGTVADLPLAAWNAEIGVSLTGAFLMSKFAVPAMVRAGGGSIVFVASQFGHVAVGKAVAYGAAKAGLIHLARMMAVDHAGENIRVNSLSPGAVATPRLLQRWPTLEAADAALGPLHLLGRIAQPREIAAAAAFLLSDDASFVTGTDLLADGGYAAR